MLMPIAYNLRSSFAVKLAAVFLGLSLLSLAYFYTRPASLHLTLEMAASRPSTAQLYYDTGNGFSERESDTVEGKSGSLSSFEKLSFTFPKTIVHLRFDPLKTEGRVVIRNLTVTSDGVPIATIPANQIRPLNQIATYTQRSNEVDLVTTPGAVDPGVSINLARPLRLGWVFSRQDLLWLAVIHLCLIGSYWLLLLAKDRVLKVTNAMHQRVVLAAEKFPAREFLPVDALALWIYAAMLCLFCGACILDLNGSSAALYGEIYGNGPRVKPWIGSPKESRADEWAYGTPDILNQYYRADRFAARESVLGNHYIGLTGNLPVKDVTTLFRPQFWGFFVLPLDYAFSVYWQIKALLLVGGMFTFLLWIVRSSPWALAGALWYLFSPFTQWSYSWPIGLPEMIGSICLGTVCFCYLTVGHSRKWLALAMIGTVFCGVVFAMSAYLPHMIPLAWASAAMLVSWCVTARKEIVSREKWAWRLAASSVALAILLAVAWMVYGELEPAITAVADTFYPGRRVLPGGTLPVWTFASHFLQWTETENHFPAMLGNICEGSGFLWLAPVTLLCIPKLRLSPFQKAALFSLWGCFVLIFCWCAFPMPAAFGKITLLDRSPGSRCVAALGLINVAIVVLTAARFQKKSTELEKGLDPALCFAGAAAVSLGVLYLTNRHLDHYFRTPVVILSALFLGLLCMLLFTGRKRTLALLLLIPQAFVYGTVNPVMRGLPIFTHSQFHEFVQSHPDLLKGKWLVYSGTPVRSGFVAAAGCQVYTGTRYVPDINHFALFAARGLNLDVFNRLGYLDARAISPGEPTRFVQAAPVIVDWYVAPNDPLLRQLGIRYVAFDSKPATELIGKLKPVNDAPLDGLWIYLAD